jgi:hypothetical protein
VCADSGTIKSMGWKREGRDLESLDMGGKCKEEDGRQMACIILDNECTS